MSGLRRAHGLVFLVAVAFWLGACTTRPSVSSPRRAAAPVLSYTIPSITAGQIDSSFHRGRVTVLLFITTFDVFSQAEAQRLEDLFHSATPRINAAAIIMEPPKNLELAQAFVDVLHLSYPVGMAAPHELERQGVLGKIKTVPAWLILDKHGRLVGSGAGTFSLKDLESAVARAR